MCAQVSREKMQSSRTDLLLHPQLEWEVEMLLFAKNQDGGHMLEQCAVFLTVANITRLNSHVVSSEPPDSYVYLKGSFICFFASFFDEIKFPKCLESGKTCSKIKCWRGKLKPLWEGASGPPIPWPQLLLDIGDCRLPTRTAGILHKNHKWLLRR